MSDVLVPFGHEFLLLSREQFREALANARELLPQQAEQSVQGDGETILDAVGMAQVTHIPASWFLEQARKNKLPHLRAGKYVRFRLGEVLEFFSAKEKDSPLLKTIR